MEGELIVVTIISTLGMIFSIMIWNHNWFKRLDAKYKYQLKRAKMQKKMKVDIPEERSRLDSLASLAPLLTKLDPEVISELAQTFMGEPEGGGSYGIKDILDVVPPELIKGFLEGVQTPKPKTPEIKYER